MGNFRRIHSDAAHDLVQGNKCSYVFVCLPLELLCRNIVTAMNTYGSNKLGQVMVIQQRNKARENPKVLYHNSGRHIQKDGKQEIRP